MKRRNPMIRSAFLLLLPAATLAAIAFEAPAMMSVQPRAELQATLLPTVHVVADVHGDAARLAVAPEGTLSVTLLPTVYVYASVREYAAVDVASDALLAATGARAVDPAGALATVAGQAACIALPCARAPY